MSDSLKICLLGPPAGGKTSLLASIRSGLQDDAHGYVGDRLLHVRSLPHPGWSNDEYKELGWLNPRNDGYNELVQSVRDLGGVSATSPDRVCEYQLEIFSHSYGGDAPETKAVNFGVYDAAGELAMPTRPSEIDMPLRPFIDLLEEIVQTGARAFSYSRRCRGDGTEQAMGP